MNQYYDVHVTPGRLRFRIPGLKGKPEDLDTLAEKLRAIEKVTKVETNALTGSVLVLHNGAEESLIQERVKERGYLPNKVACRLASPLKAGNNKTSLWKCVLVFLLIDLAGKALLEKIVMPGQKT